MAGVDSRRWGEEPSLGIREAAGIVDKLIADESPGSPAAVGLFSTREYAALKRLREYALACLRAAPRVGRRRS